MLDRPPLESVLPLLTRLAGAMEQLAALGVHLSSSAGTAPTVHPAVAGVLDDIARLSGVPAALSREDRAIASAFVRTSFRQAADLLDHPDRPPRWSSDDPVLVETQGRASAVVTRIVLGLADGALRERLAAPNATLLDIGTGAGWLAISMAQAFPTLRVVGLDRDATVLAHARRNIAAAALADRITLVEADATNFAPTADFDVTWIPGPFLDAPALRRVARMAYTALGAGGWALLGSYGAEDPTVARLADLRAIRSGGSPWSSVGFAELLGEVGFVGAAEVPKQWPAPFRLMTARKSP